MTWYPLSIHLRSVNDKVQKEHKSDKKYGKDYMKSKCTSSDYGELFVLRFYGPVNPMGSCRARSVYLTTLLLGRLSPLSG